MDLIATARQWVERGHRVALATVIATWGSSPRPVGSQLVINDREAFFGSVSGGCIESTILTEAQFTIRDNIPQRLSIGIGDRKTWDYGLGCGGSIDIYVEPVASWQPVLATLTELADQRKSYCLITNLCDSSKALYCPDRPDVSFGLDRDLRSAAGSAIDSGFSRLEKLAGSEFFLHVFSPPPQIIVGGAVHIAQPLVAMAQLMGYTCTIVDPRTTFATGQRFPGVDLIVEHPKTALKKIQWHTGTSVVALSHSPQLDDPLLIHAINVDANYIGALGSKKTHADRIDRLRKEGLTDGQLDRIHGPVGLDIGSRTPSEIALSIMAEITQRKRKG
ncbi:MAG: XdhC family protein [Deltaproteobacteria bacterium]|nr:XdhC family protein [Deltaproteobacteria bacterium]